MLRRAGLFPIAFLLAACASGTPTPTAAPAPSATPPAVEASSDARPSTSAASDAPAVADAAPRLTAAPDAWQLLDLDADRVPGVSAARAYDELLAGRTPARTVVVAVIDGGIDTAHVDLRANLCVEAM